MHLGVSSGEFSLKPHAIGSEEVHFDDLSCVCNRLVVYRAYLASNSSDVAEDVDSAKDLSDVTDCPPNGVIIRDVNRLNDMASLGQSQVLGRRLESLPIEVEHEP